MSAQDEAVVRRFYEEMANGRKNELAADLFTAEHRMHDPQVAADDGPDGVAAAVSTYQTGVNGHWEINDIFSSGDKVVVRWTGTGEHVAEVNGIAPTGNRIDVSAISIHRMEDGRIAETWEVWDTLGFLQQIGVVPTMG
jgi:predicted ester cyclase